MVFLFALLGGVISYILFGNFARSSSEIDAIMAATVILSGSIWGAAAWIVGTLKKIGLSNNKSEN